MFPSSECQNSKNSIATSGFSALRGIAHTLGSPLLNIISPSGPSAPGIPFASNVVSGSSVLFKLLNNPTQASQYVTIPTLSDKNNCCISPPPLVAKSGSNKPSSYNFANHSNTGIDFSVAIGIVLFPSSSITYLYLTPSALKNG